MTVMGGEARMLPSLTTWLERTGRLRQATGVAYELPWLGRRVDLALMTGRGVTTAFELKIGNIHRALEQAAYNRASFHRSWIVTGNRPGPDAVEWSRRLGVGILVVRGTETSIAVPALPHRPNSAAIRRLREVMKKRARECGVAAL